MKWRALRPWIAEWQTSHLAPKSTVGDRKDAWKDRVFKLPRPDEHRRTYKTPSNSMLSCLATPAFPRLYEHLRNPMHAHKPAWWTQAQVCLLKDTHPM